MDIPRVDESEAEYVAYQQIEEEYNERYGSTERSNVTTTRTTTHTNTYTLEEKAVLEAIEVRKWGRFGRWTMDEIQEFVHHNAESTKDSHEPLIDVADWLTPVIVGQLIERGLVYRGATDPETYTRA